MEPPAPGLPLARFGRRWAVVHREERTRPPIHP